MLLESSFSSSLFSSNFHFQLTLNVSKLWIAYFVPGLYRRTHIPTPVRMRVGGVGLTVFSFVIFDVGVEVADL